MGPGARFGSARLRAMSLQLTTRPGAILSSFSVPNSTFTGVAFDGTNLWFERRFDHQRAVLLHHQRHTA